MLPEKKSVAKLKTVAEKVGLAPCSVSAVLNNTLAAQAIPQRTKERIFRAVAELNYRPNLWARSLRTKRTRMIALVAHDFGRTPVAQVVAGVQTRLQENGYLLALGNVDVSDSTQLCLQLQQRGIEGVIAIDSAPPSLQLPIALVELGDTEISEPLPETIRAWLAGVGESAAETIVEQIEKQNGALTTIPAKVPPGVLLCDRSRGGISPRNCPTTTPFDGVTGVKRNQRMSPPSLVFPRLFPAAFQKVGTHSHPVGRAAAIFESAL